MYPRVINAKSHDANVTHLNAIGHDIASIDDWVAWRDNMALTWLALDTTMQGVEA
jgi:hypothetical protein